jgi:protein involved in sex pheromone biosynthesis
MKKTMLLMMTAAVLLTGCTEHVRMNDMEDAVVA